MEETKKDGKREGKKDKMEACSEIIELFKLVNFMKQKHVQGV
jgi:hypothetical protein